MTSHLSSTSAHAAAPANLKLPAIRTLATFNEPIRGSAAPVLNPSSPPAAANGSHRPLPWPLHEDSRSQGDCCYSSVSNPSLPTKLSSSSLASSSIQDSRHLPRPQLHRPASSSGPSSAPGQQHPFFDKGRKESLYIRPPGYEKEAKEVDTRAAEREAEVTRELSIIEDSLTAALAIVADGKRDTSYLSQETFEAASSETSKALFLLQKMSAQGRFRGGLPTGPLPTPRRATSSSELNGVAFSPMATWTGRPSSSSGSVHVPGEHPLHASAKRATMRYGSDAAGSVWALKPQPSHPDTEDPRPRRETRTVYEGHDPEVNIGSNKEDVEDSSSPQGSPRVHKVSPRTLPKPTPQPAQSNDNAPRPPTTVVRTTSSTPSLSSNDTPNGIGSSGPEGEASYMYAPPSIRNRLASLHDQQQRVLPAPVSAQPPPQSVFTHDWDRTHHRPGASIPPPARPEPRWTASTSPAVTKPWSAAPSDHVNRVALPDRTNGYWQENTGTQEGQAADQESSGTKYKKRSRAPAPSACRNCGTNETPEWRRGPDGARTLCNACGLHFAKVSKRKSSTGDVLEDSAASNGGGGGGSNGAAWSRPPLNHHHSGSST